MNLRRKRKAAHDPAIPKRHCWACSTNKDFRNNTCLTMYFPNYRCLYPQTQWKLFPYLSSLLLSTNWYIALSVLKSTCLILTSAYHNHENYEIASPTWLFTKLVHVISVGGWCPWTWTVSAKRLFTMSSQWSSIGFNALLFVHGYLNMSSILAPQRIASMSRQLSVLSTYSVTRMTH